MKKVTHTTKKPSKDLNLFVWPADASIRYQEKYWNTGKVNHKTVTYSDDGLTCVTTQIWTDEGWEESRSEKDPTIVSAIIASTVWNKENGIITSTIVQDV